MSTGGHAYDALGRILSSHGVENLGRDFLRRGSVGNLGDLIKSRFPNLSQVESDFLVNQIMESEKAATEFASLGPAQSLDPSQVPVNQAVFGNSPTANRYLYSGTFTIFDANGTIIGVKYGNVPSVDPLSPDELNEAFRQIVSDWFSSDYEDLSRLVNSNPGYTTKWTLTAIQRSY